MEDLRAMAADRAGASFELFELTEQHRSGGSNAYESWVDALLDGHPVPWVQEDDYQLILADSPAQLETLTFSPTSQGAKSGARLLAGFCWTWLRWPDGAATIDDIPFDINIHGWRKRWNLRHAIDGYPEASSWAANPSGAEQVGSVFTAQGFEFGRCGVILGPDFRWDQGTDQWLVDVTKTRYEKLQAAARTSADFEDLIRNHYRVLLTRAMAATVIYSTDAATRSKLAELVPSAAVAGMTVA